MLLVISPSKTMDFEPSPLELSHLSQPVFLKEAKALVKNLKKLKVKELEQLMDISEKLASQNVARFHEFKTPFTEQNAKIALLAYQGDVYNGMDTASFDAQDIDFAQTTLAIISGLYGVLLPKDLIQAYRLEMSIAVQGENYRNLYEFWGSKITDYLQKLAKKNKSKAIVNLASNEYASAIQPQQLQLPFYNIYFQEFRNGKYQTIALNAKKARGMMCHYVIKNRLTEVSDLQQFNAANYAFNAELSNEFNWYFTKH